MQRLDIEHGIDQCEQELDNAIQIFTVRCWPDVHQLSTHCNISSSSMLTLTMYEPRKLRLSFRNQISFQRAQMDARTLELQNHTESRDLLLQVLANQEELKRVVALHQAGSSIAEEMMQEGQEVTALF